MIQINPKVETDRIVKFIQKALKDQDFKKLVIGISGGIDSAVCSSLAIRAIGQKNVFNYFLPYKDQYLPNLDLSNIKIINIGKAVDTIVETTETKDKISIGNIIARTRMIMLFNAAKENNALVCGTENRSESLLGYFTRFGDAASDLEPISHLYKTQVFELAKFLKIPKAIIEAAPSASLWPKQTDEVEFGFTYKIADEILFRYFDKKESLESINKDFGKNEVDKVLKRVKNNLFKQLTPYRLQPSLKA
jgi:NAD+ synthase